ncbi:hypothetical protein ACFC14_02340 [Microbacterium sp. NPDC055988]|uniref:hypothetical protein n=1 Tax=Microbacterium sp. NPDC055988 TaxID=3345671 RepID=UPI0035DF63F7
MTNAHRTARPRSGRLLRVIAGILIGAGVLLAVVAVVAPERVERAYGATKSTVDAIAAGVRATVLDELPRARLGATGGKAELSRCDDTFTQMASYTRAGVPPVWAAHNNCGGDVILNWQLGDHVILSTAQGDVEYEVVEVRHVPKTWSSTDDLLGLDGDLALQTCLYGQDIMDFVGLDRVGD